LIILKLSHLLSFTAWFRWPAMLDYFKIISPSFLYSSVSLPAMFDYQLSTLISFIVVFRCLLCLIILSFTVGFRWPAMASVHAPDTEAMLS
jgi:hypothetical protein